MSNWSKLGVPNIIRKHASVPNECKNVCSPAHMHARKRIKMRAQELLASLRWNSLRQKWPPFRSRWLESYARNLQLCLSFRSCLEFAFSLEMNIEPDKSRQVDQLRNKFTMHNNENMLPQSLAHINSNSQTRRDCLLSDLHSRQFRSAAVLGSHDIFSQVGGN